MKKIRIPYLKKILQPSWAHKLGYGVNKTGWIKTKIWEQATIPKDPKLLEKLSIKKTDSILAVAGYYASWASKLAQAGADVTYSDISRSILNYVKKNVKTKFTNYICSNYELIPKKPKQYDWTFTFEACGGSQGLPVAYLRSLLNNKGGILVLFFERGGRMGGKYRKYPRIVKTLSRIYKTNSSVKRLNIRGDKKGYPLTILPHRVYTIKTNDVAREKASLDLKVLDYVNNKRVIHSDKDSKKLEISKKNLEDSITRLNKFSDLVADKFTKQIVLK